MKRTRAGAVLIALGSVGAAQGITLKPQRGAGWFNYFRGTGDSAVEVREVSTPSFEDRM